MNTKVISLAAQEMISHYKNFRVGSAVCSIPYYNNKVAARRAALRVEVGKGSPKDIFEEITHRALAEKVDVSLLDSENLKKFLVNSNLGIDCSGFAYYILNEESLSRGKGTLDKHIHFIHASNSLTRFIAKFKPQTNIDVLTFADDANSRKSVFKEIEPGDIITMLGGPDGGERNHILVINQVEYQNFVPITIHYVHAIAWPTDGKYGHGIHDGRIEIIDPNKPIIEQRWIENEKTGEENYTFSRAQKSTTEVRKLNW
jgi:hypothetical protein